jgi:fluoroacetyl-CoA thioesterase
VSDSLPTPGATGEASLTVAFADTAKALASDPRDDFPEVLATARMVALMELAAARVLAPLLGPGELSVGVDVAIRHTAATPSGVGVRALARYTGREGKLFRFEVEAFDAGGKVGGGWHTRALIDGARLVQGARTRAGG